MSEDTQENNFADEAPQTAVVMDSAEFEAKLTEFFTRHRESKLRLVPRIAAEFKGSEDMVLKHLHNKYVLGNVPEKPKKEHTPESEATSSAGKAPLAAPPKKSKKKLILLIVVAVVLGGLGAGFFMFKDKLLGKKSEEVKTETPAAESAPAAEQPKEEKPATQPEATKTDSVPAPAAEDSTK